MIHVPSFLAIQFNIRSQFLFDYLRFREIYRTSIHDAKTTWKLHPLSSSLAWGWSAQEDRYIDFHMQQIHGYINYNFISHHMSILATASSPSGSILVRASNPIKIEKLNCDDPIRALTKRAPFLIRPESGNAKVFHVCTRSVRGYIRPFVSERGEEKEPANVRSARHTWVWQRGHNNTALHCTMYAFECLIMKKLIKSQSSEAFCWGKRSTVQPTRYLNNKLTNEKKRLLDSRNLF